MVRGRVDGLDEIVSGGLGRDAARPSSNVTMRAAIGGECGEDRIDFELPSLSTGASSLASSAELGAEAWLSSRVYSFSLVRLVRCATSP